MNKQSTFQPGGFWLVTLAAILWGTIGVATQAIYQSDTVNSLFINLARMLVATPILLIACWRLIGRDLFRVAGRDRQIIVLSGILIAISQGCYFASIQIAGVTIATLIIVCTAPLIVTGVSVALRAERFSRLSAAALVLGVIGSALLVGVGVPDKPLSMIAPGALFALVGAITYAGVIVCGRHVAARYHPLQVTTIQFIVATVAFVILNVIAGAHPVISSKSWLLIGYLGIVPTAIAYLLFQMGLRRVAASTASVIGMLDPLVAALLAWVLLGERLAASGLIGGGLLLAALMLLALNERRSQVAHAV